MEQNNMYKISDELFDDYVEKLSKLNDEAIDLEAKYLKDKARIVTEREKLQIKLATRVGVPMGEKVSLIGQGFVPTKEEKGE